MRRNPTEIEQRFLSILKKNSRISIIDAASELGVSRMTAKKALDAMVSEGKIRGFTIATDEDLKNLAIVHVETMENFPMEMVSEHYRLIDGTNLAVIYYEDLTRLNDVKILDVKIVTERTIQDKPVRLEHIHCDYCENGLSRNSITFELQGKTYYACCPACERGLRNRAKRLSGDATVS